MQKTGLILEGGAMRGMFTCGAIDVLLENGIAFDGMMGVSAGAVFGCNFKSGQIGRAVRYNKRFCGDKRYASFHSLLKTGNLYNEEFCYHTVPEQLDPFDAAAFEKNPMEFYCVCTDIKTGRAVYHPCKTGGAEDVEWMRASASMPIVSRPVNIGGQLLLDGGIADSIPLKAMEALGYSRNFIILTQPLGFQKQKNKLVPLARVVLRKYPAVVAALANRHVHYNETTAYVRAEEKAGRVFVLRPEAPLEIGSTEKSPAELERVYQAGRSAMTAQLAALKAFLAEAAAPQPGTLRLSIEKATPADTDAVAGLYDAACDWLAAHENGPGWKKGVYPTREDAAAGIAENHLYVARAKGRVVGTFILRHTPEEGYAKADWHSDADYKQIFVVYTFVVHPECLRRGAGTQMLREILALAKGAGMAEVRLDVVAANAPACALYERCGFAYVDTVDLGYAAYGLPEYRLYQYKL